MESVRKSYVAKFGEDEARMIECAAEMHKNGVHGNPGSDPFKWAVAICIEYDCVKKYADSHGIEVSNEDFIAWVKAEAHLESHDGYELYTLWV